MSDLDYDAHLTDDERNALSQAVVWEFVHASAVNQYGVGVLDRSRCDRIVVPAVERILHARLLDLAQRAEAAEADARIQADARTAANERAERWRARCEEARAAVERVRALADELAAERDTLRAHYRSHNAGRAPNQGRKRPDLATWANAYEVAERKVRAALDPQEDQ